LRPDMSGDKASVANRRFRVSRMVGKGVPSSRALLTTDIRDRFRAAAARKADAPLAASCLSRAISTSFQTVFLALHVAA
jgi:hypothetical protein